MVDLSLKHRVDFDQRAIVDDGANAPRTYRTPLLAILAIISTLNVFFLFVGIALAAMMDYTWDSTEQSRPGEWYREGSASGHRAYA
jgi:hypothetical protein